MCTRQEKGDMLLQLYKQTMNVGREIQRGEPLRVPELEQGRSARVAISIRLMNVA